MNENIDLTKILKDCPKGMKLYTPSAGEVYFVGIKERNEYQIDVENKDFNGLSFNKQGRYFSEFEDGECLLFPAIDQRDWSKFTAPRYKKDKFDPKTLKPFDKVLLRDTCSVKWKCGIFSHINDDNDEFRYYTVGKCYVLCIPYNDDTKHLVGTTEEAPEYYRYWED